MRKEKVIDIHVCVVFSVSGVPEWGRGQPSRGLPLFIFGRKA